ncbi:hypothetical protein ACFW2D_30135 [Streptomyces sp. NPDC058914]
MTDDRRGGPVTEASRRARFYWIQGRFQDLVMILEATGRRARLRTGSH